MEPLPTPNTSDHAPVPVSTLSAVTVYSLDYSMVNLELLSQDTSDHATVLVSTLSAITVNSLYYSKVKRTVPWSYRNLKWSENDL